MRLADPMQKGGRFMAPVVVIIGAGPGLGAAVARAFGQAGYHVGLIARRETAVAALGQRLQGDGITVGWTAADAANPTQVRAAVERLGGHAGRIDVLHYNVVAFRSTSAAQLDAQELLDDLAAGTAGLLPAVSAARPFMSAGSAVLATGSLGADRPMRSAASLGVQKAALRNLVTALDLDLRGDGIRAATVTVNGTIAEGTKFDPARIAPRFVDLARRAGNSEWRSEVAYNG